jgi:endonuclease/exonuclease/phosphatase family metal-dependent hydrolase
MTQTLSIATWNIHKGFSQFNRRMMVHELRERLRELSADIVFLQEVQGLHLRARRAACRLAVAAAARVPRRRRLGQPRLRPQHGL